MALYQVEVPMTGMDTAAYAAGDQVGVITAVAGVGQGGGSPCKLVSVTVVDKAKQSAAIDILLFDELPTVASSNNAAVNVSAAQLTDKCLGVVKIAAANYSALSACSVATVVPGNAIKPIDSATIYILLSTTGTPTYTAATDLVLRFAFED